MGNTTSSPREDSSPEQPDHLPDSNQHQHQNHPSRSSRSILPPLRLRASTQGRASGSDTNRRNHHVYGTFRRRISAQSTQFQPNAGAALGTNEVVYEQEERPLVSMEDLRMGDAPITHITAQPLARRASTMSRLGSRFLPDSVIRGLQMSGEETESEGHAHRTGSWTFPNRITRATERRMGRSATVRPAQRLRDGARADLRRHSLRDPFSINTSNAALSQISTSGQDISSFSSSTTLPNTLEQSEGTWSRRTRMVRNSLSLPLGNFFSRGQERDNATPMADETSTQPMDTGSANRSEHLLPPLSTMDHTLDFNNHHGQDISTTTSESESPHVLTPSMSLNSGSSTPSALRRFPHSLRSRGRITRNAQPGQPPLAQVLHLAASAIAAQLSGHGGNSISNMQPLAGSGFDGTIQSFVQTLQQAASAQARNGENGSNATGEDDGHLPPVNFLRVFSFPNNESTGNSNATSNSTPRTGGSDRMESDQNNEDRSVTLVLVGVRSMPHGDMTSGEDGNTANPSLDSLLNLPFLPPSNLLRNGSSGALLRRSDNRQRFSSRRNSMSNFSSFPQQYDSQRHHRTRSSTNRSNSEAIPIVTPQSTTPTVLSESPPGPIPPPSTPAEPFLSGQSTPIRRPSSASAMAPPPTLPELSEDSSSSNTQTMEDNLTTPDPSHYRRRSDSEFARRPELSSGASRRNGVVEPDANSNSPGGRSWLIYVVGTNVSPDHPAFTMPSLFTDNPSYEDMQLLSSLLGPVKPPVATQGDVTSSGGLYRLVRSRSNLIAQPCNEELTPFTLQIGDRCLICLCDYDVAEEVRQLHKCKHMYHRECIDEWLTTGRNSCPLCRGQGVGESSSNANNHNNESTTNIPSPA